MRGLILILIWTVLALPAALVIFPWTLITRRHQAAACVWGFGLLAPVCRGVEYGSSFTDSIACRAGHRS